MLRKIFDFFIFSSLFIACCAVLMVYQTSILFDIPFTFELAAFVFSGSVCSYNFHWYLIPPDLEKRTGKLAWNISNKTVHLLLFIAGLVGSLVFSVLMIEHWFWLGITAFSTFMYSAPKISFPIFNQLRKVAIAKTVYLAFAWAHITTLLPMVMHLDTLNFEHVLFFVNRFFFIYAICIVFDYRDVEEDKKEGIRSLITYLSESGINILFWSSMAVYYTSSLILLEYFPMIQIAALLIPGLILSLLYYRAKSDFSDYLYYFVLDGLMMLSAPLLLLTKFAR